MRSPDDPSQRSTPERAGDRRYEAVLEAIDQGFCVIEVELDAQGHGRDYRFLEINPAFTRLTGIENAPGRSMREIAPAHEQHWFDRYADVALTGRPARFEHEAHALAGGKWFDVFAFRVDEPLDRHVAILFSDVTERRQARRALIASETRFRGLIELSPIGIALGDPDGRILLANDAFLSMLGYRREEAPHLDWTALTPPEHRDFAAAHVQALRKSERAISFEKDLVRKDGTRITVMLVAQFMPGESDRMMAYALDISDRKRNELALRENEQRLAESATALRDADRRKDDFLATLAHELRNPLAPIRNGIELMRLVAGSNSMLERTTLMMERQMQHLVRLVDDLLDVSRITRGKVELRRERLPINEVVAAALESCQTLFEPREQRLSISLAPEPMIVLGDADRLRQVFSNLLSNAAKFTPRQGTIWIDLERSGVSALVRVRDTGVGIPHERLAQVFEMFAQVESPHRNDGLGIGLALARQLVSLHGGSIEARSDGPGKGSEFIVCLPLTDVEPTVASRGAPAVSPAAARKRVLIVDDNIDGAESLADILRLRGHAVHTARGGEQAIALTARDPPDVILMDLGMPDMDGLTAARLIRQQPRSAAIRIIALTGWGQEKDRERTRAAGIEEHLVKPASPDALIESIEQH